MRSLAAPVLLLLAAASAQAHKPTTTKFTYHLDVYPIFLSKCGSCHRTGGVAPMSLLSYKETYPWAVAIKNEVLSLSMPPWFADERYGEFKHRSALTAREVNTIVDWCLGGTPEGEPSDAPTTDVVADDGSWPLGQPDVVLAMPEPFTLSAADGEAVHEVNLPTGLRRDRLVRAFDFRPGSPNVVRSALVFVQRVSRDGDVTPQSLVSSWIPGEEREEMPKGTGIRLRKKGSLVLRIHYKKTWLDEGKAVSDRSELAIYFQEKAKGNAVESLVVDGTKDAAIRPNGAGFETTVELPLSRRVDVLAVLARIDARLTGLRAEVVLPEGGARDLISLIEPHPGWPRKFWLETPLALPGKSRIRLTLIAPEEALLRRPHFLVVDVIQR